MGPAQYSTTSGGFGISVDTAEWVFAATNKLSALSSRKANWDSYGGLPLKQGAKGLTLRVLGWLGTYDLPVPAVVLGSSGSVQLEWRGGGKELEVELRDDGTVEFVKVARDGRIYEGEAATDLPAILRELTLWFQRK